MVSRVNGAVSALPYGLLAGVIVMFASPAVGQLRVIEEVSLTGTVESVAGGRMTVRDEAGDRREVRVQARGERGAIKRVHAREKAIRPTAHRPNVGADIRYGMKLRSESVRERGKVGALGHMVEIIERESDPKTPARKAGGKR